MKKGYLLPLLALVLAGCSNQDFTGNTDNGGQLVPTDRKNLTVSLIPTQGGLTKADPAPGEYIDGDESEAKVNNVRFFFFDGDGYATPVWENRSSGNYNSYYDWYPNASDITPGDSNETVETNLRTTLGIMVPQGCDNPAYVLAVINPTTDILNLNTSSQITVGEGDQQVQIQVVGPSLEELRGVTADYYTGLHNNNFVMSNSVYVVEDNGEKSVVEATEIKEENFATTAEEIGTNPVTIYVERVLARLDFGISSAMTGVVANGDTIYKVGNFMIDQANGTQTPDSTAIYVRLLGWNVTTTAATSRLIKNVNPAWTSNELFGNTEIWNTSDYHRSFWALNPNGLTYNYGNFGEDPVEEPGDEPGDEPGQDPGETVSNSTPTSANYLDIAGAGLFNHTYLQENANAYSASGAAAKPASRSQVIIAAQLCDVNGNAMPIAEWNYHKFSINDMLTFLCSTQLSQLFYKEAGNASSTYTKIAPADLTFKTAAQLGLQTDDADFYVYVVLTDEAEDYDWYVKGLDGNYTSYTSDAVNDYIYDLINHVRVWNNGWAYYFFDVEHLGAATYPGFQGIVRNHAYRTVVKGIKGLGTPVYDPEQEIIPEENTYDESIITADIKVLQWRLVKSEYDINW